ncbi:MAG: neutral/alkaline non-lysosomal ceramidase N-terminal domain-containing protein, partial [Candidatus Methanomethylicia archaeon]
RLWGAAKHYQSTGIHRPLYADAIALSPLNIDKTKLIIVTLDMCTMMPKPYNELLSKINKITSIPTKNIIVTFSHTHSAGWLFEPEDHKYPGTEMIPSYLQSLYTKVSEACIQAISNMQEAIITYAEGKCNLACNRDFWDDNINSYVVGFNPDVPADDTIIVARITNKQGKLLATIVNYACHPTTLAWQNTLISPDFIGAMRETIEKNTNSPCIFLQGASGDLCPREGYVGDTTIADKNGRQLAYAVLSVLESMGPPEMDYQYINMIESGARLGEWSYVPFTAERKRDTSLFIGGSYVIDLPMKESLPKPEELKKQVEYWEKLQKEAIKRGDEKAARDAGAFAERCRRLLSRLMHLDNLTTYPLNLHIYRFGDAIWIFIEGEIYSLLQTELRKKFEGQTILISTLAGSWLIGYITPIQMYKKGAYHYQSQVSLAAPGSLEKIIERISYEIMKLNNTTNILGFT